MLQAYLGVKYHIDSFWAYTTLPQLKVSTYYGAL